MNYSGKIAFVLSLVLMASVASAITQGAYAPVVKLTQTSVNPGDSIAFEVYIIGGGEIVGSPRLALYSENAEFGCDLSNVYDKPPVESVQLSLGFFELPETYFRYIENTTVPLPTIEPITCLITFFPDSPQGLQKLSVSLIYSTPNGEFSVEQTSAEIYVKGRFEANEGFFAFMALVIGSLLAIFEVYREKLAKHGAWIIGIVLAISILLWDLAEVSFDIANISVPAFALAIIIGLAVPIIGWLRSRKMRKASSLK